MTRKIRERLPVRFCWLRRGVPEDLFARQHKSGRVSIPYFDDEGVPIGFRRFDRYGAPTGWIGADCPLPLYGLLCLPYDDKMDGCVLVLVEGESAVLHLNDFFNGPAFTALRAGVMSADREFVPLGVPDGESWDGEWVDDYDLGSFGKTIVVGSEAFCASVTESLPEAVSIRLPDDCSLTSMIVRDQGEDWLAAAFEGVFSNAAG